MKSNQLQKRQQLKQHQAKAKNEYNIILLNIIFIVNNLTLSFDASSYVATVIPWARKHNIAPSHNNNAKPPNICLQNFTHSGVVLGGVNAFGPSRANTSAAFASVKPY